MYSLFLEIIGNYQYSIIMVELTTNQKIGKIIKKLRADKKLTQVQLSDELSIHPKHLSNIENGRKAPTISILDKLCDVFDKPHMFFFDFVKHDLNDSDTKLINNAIQMLRSTDSETRKNLIQVISIFTDKK